MKIVCRILLGFFLTGYCFTLSSQGSNNQSLGLQLNPYLDEGFFNQSFIMPVYALRYSVEIKEHLTLGPELSGTAFKSKSTGNTSNTLRIGGFVRYSFLPEARIRPFAELSPYFAYYSWNYNPDGYFVNIEPKGSKSYFSGYIAPGISLYSKSKKLSIDLFYKFSDRKFINGKQSIFSYRLNYNF